MSFLARPYNQVPATISLCRCCYLPMPLCSYLLKLVVLSPFGPIPISIRLWYTSRPVLRCSVWYYQLYGAPGGYKPPATLLWVCYAQSGTDTCYVATSSLSEPYSLCPYPSTYKAVLARSPGTSCPILLRACYEVPGTAGAYGLMPFLVLKKRVGCAMLGTRRSVWATRCPVLFTVLARLGLVQLHY